MVTTDNQKRNRFVFIANTNHDHHFYCSHHHHHDHHDHQDHHGQSACGVRAGWVLGVSTLPHRSRQGGHWKVDDDDHHYSDVDDGDDHHHSCADDGDGDGEDDNDDDDNDGNPGTLATSLASARSPPPLSTYT